MLDVAGNLFVLDSHRSGQDNLWLDGAVDVKSVPDVSGGQVNLIPGLVGSDDRIYLTNHSDEQSADGLHGFGAIVASGAGKARLCMDFVNDTDLARMAKHLGLLVAPIKQRI